MTPIERIEEAIVDMTFGRMTRPQAIAEVMSVFNVTEFGAADLLDHKVAPRRRYEAAIEVVQ